MTDTVQNWEDMTDDQLRSYIRKTVRSCKSAGEVHKKLSSEIGYPYHVAVSYSEPNAVGQRMSSFMAHGRNGILS